MSSEEVACEPGFKEQGRGGEESIQQVQHKERYKDRTVQGSNVLL